MEGLSRLEVERGRQRSRGASMGCETTRESRDTDDVTGEHNGLLDGIWRLMVQERKYEVTEVAVEDSVSKLGRQQRQRRTYSSRVLCVKIIDERCRSEKGWSS